jgi:hypothetical protein
MSTATPTPITPAPTAEEVVGFRIMRETEIAPHWWAKPVEIGETGSGAVAEQFCSSQNAVTMNPNREKRQRYFIEPVFADEAESPRGFAAITESPAIVRAVTVYETAALHRATLAELAETGQLSDLDAEGFDIAADLMAGARATLAAAGMLHLIEAEHEKTKGPLPTRPRGPHPQRVTAVA